MSECKLNKNQIKFLENEFSKNNHLKTCWNYKKWGTLEGILSQIKEGVNPIVFITTDLSSSNTPIFTHLNKENKQTYQYKLATMQVQEQTLLSKILSFFNVNQVFIVNSIPEEVEFIYYTWEYFNEVYSPEPKTDNGEQIQKSYDSRFDDIEYQLNKIEKTNKASISKIEKKIEVLFEKKETSNDISED